MSSANRSPRAARISKFLTAASFIPLLAACAPEFNPPPDYQGGFLWNSDKSRTITVEPGDSLYAISQRYDVPIKVIIARNALRPPYAPTPGQELVLDPVRTHRVVAGETLDGIARQSGVDVSLIAEANDLRQPYSVHPDQDLWIPDPFTVAAATAVPTAPASTDLTRPVQMAMATQSSDTSSIHGPAIAVETLAPPPGTPVAPDFGPPAQPNGPPPAAPQTPATPAASGPAGTLPPASPALQPAIPQTAPPLAPQSPQAVPPGLQPVTPQTPAPQVAPPPQTSPPGLQPAMPQTPAPQTPPPVIPSTPAPAPPVTVPGSAAASAPPPTQLAAIPPAETTESVAPPATRFIWPVKGRLISGFGPAGKGLHNDGINIAAPLGTQVRAVDNGVVAYAGSELKGFGNLLLIKHADGLTTAYAHNEKLLVAKGDVVKKGQVVATVGKTGGVDSPQLHFEVRLGTQAVDPDEYLQQVASH